MIGVLTDDEARYLDVAALFVVMVDPEQRIAFINNKGASLLGYRREALLGQNWFDVAVPESERAEVKRIFTEIIVAGLDTVEYYENPVMDRENALHHMAWNNAVIRGPQGDFRYSFSSGIDISEKKVLESQLVSVERNRRQQLLAVTLESQERERHHLAQELHDNINQQLTACKLLLEQTMVPAAANSPLMEKAYQALNKAISDIRSLSHQMETVQLEQGDFFHWLQDLVATLNATGKLQIQFSHQQATINAAFTPLLQRTLYRVVQEQLTNVLKHAKATTVRITATVDEQAVEVEIEDDGIGFDLQAVRKGLGLKAMQNRIELLEGRLYLATAPGDGCTLSLYVPLHAAQVNAK